MREIAPGIVLLGYRIVHFTFDAKKTQGKSGWGVHSAIEVTQNLEGKWEGKLTLNMHFFSEGEKTFTVHLVAEAQFLGDTLEKEKFETLCRTQGAALLVHPLRQFVQDFLEKVCP